MTSIVYSELTEMFLPCFSLKPAYEALEVTRDHFNSFFDNNSSAHFYVYVKYRRLIFLNNQILSAL